MNNLAIRKDDDFVRHFIDSCERIGFDPQERIQFLAAQDWTPTEPTTNEELAVINRALRKLSLNSSFELMTDAIRAAFAAKPRRSRRSASTKRLKAAVN